jgi:hypothetical protein
MKNVIVSVDAGNKVSGVIVLLNDRIEYAENAENSRVMVIINEYKLVSDSLFVLIEDIKPYSLKMGQTVIDTIKYIGSLEHRLKEAGIEFKLIGRSEVKKWIFNEFSDLCVERIDKKIQYLTKLKESKGEKGLRSLDGSLRKASFIFIDDRIVIAAMKEYWSIPTPKPGKTNEYGISAHAWQALALAVYHITGK